MKMIIFNNAGEDYIQSLGYEDSIILVNFYYFFLSIQFLIDLNPLKKIVILTSIEYKHNEIERYKFKQFECE